MRAGEKCLVVGSGLSGISAVACLEYMGAEVTLYDSNEKLTQEDLRALLPAESKAACVTGELPEEILGQVETLVLSPGVPTDIPLVDRLRQNGAEVIGERWSCFSSCAPVRSSESPAAMARLPPPPWWGRS